VNLKHLGIILFDLRCIQCVSASKSRPPATATETTSPGGDNAYTLPRPGGNNAFQQPSTVSHTRGNYEYIEIIG